MEEENKIYPIFDKMLQRSDKEQLLNQRSVMIWFTGLSGSAKVPSPSPWNVSFRSVVCSVRYSMVTTSVAESTTIWASLPKTERKISAVLPK